MAADTEPKFSGMRKYLWPVRSVELRKLVPMLLIAFFIGFVYNMLRSMKDSLIVTAATSGAEVIPFLKVWFMLPVAIVLTTAYIKLSHKYRFETVFYIMIAFFLSFFTIFTFVLYPLRDVIHPHGFADWLQTVLPVGLRGLVGTVRFWSFSLFYAMAETWGVINLTILFWGFANEITHVSEAKRFYGLFGLGINLSSIAAGEAGFLLSSRTFNPNWGIGTDVWHQSLILLTLSVLVAGAIILGIFRYIQQTILKDMKLDSKAHEQQLAKLEHKPSMKESFSYITKSRYLLSIATIVVCYNLFINLVEVLWKHQVKQLYPNPNEYNMYMSHVTSITGVVACFFGLFVAGNVIRKFGWTKAAMWTPFILMITSVGFFGFLLFPEHKLTVINVFLGITPMALVALFGSAQNVLSRASKYTLFDATKELCFIPLSREARVKGKAAIDGVASRMGKSGGSVIYQGLLLMSGGLARCGPYIAGLLVLILSGWMLAVKSLGRQFGRLTAEPKQPAPVPAEDEAATESVVA